MSDTVIILLLVLSMIGAFCLGLTPLAGRRIASYAFLLGFSVNAALQLPEGGPGLCIGTVLLPIIYSFLAACGRVARGALIRLGLIESPPPPPGPVCPGCGYCLRGLPERICPECGRPFTPDEADASTPREEDDTIDQQLRRF